MWKNKQVRILIVTFSVVLAVLVLSTGCDNTSPTGKSHSQVTSKDASNTVSTVTETAMTRDEAYRIVITRIQGLATSPEAKEYVAMYLMDSAGLKEYFPEEQAWRVGISAGPEGYDAIKRASWFRVKDQGHFFDTHWDEPRPTWAVLKDATVIPTGKGLMIEADIAELNSTGMIN